ncbi:MAG TPA: extracellular solute-binding protein, partial [Limnochordia bacterium]|nr:extracellular solute-binding protein [Limnochordia bacterium]
PQLTSTAATEALTFLADLVNTDELDTLGLKHDIFGGSTAMIWDDAGSWSQPVTQTRNLRVSTFPYLQQKSTFLGAPIIMIPKTAKNRAGAAALVKFLMAPEQQDAINHASGELPYYPEAAHWDWVSGQAAIANFMAAAAYGAPNPADAHWFDIRTVIRDTVTAAFAQKDSPHNLLAQANTRILGLLK